MDLFLLATETAGEIMSDAGITILIGMVVVFLLLIILTAIFKLFGAVMYVIEEKTATVPAAPTVTAPVATPVAATPAPVVDLGPVMSSAEVRNGISDEETAVIAAAVAVSMPAGQPYTIKKIDRAE